MRTSFRLLKLSISLAACATAACALGCASSVPPPVEAAPPAPATLTRIAPVAVSSPVRNLRPTPVRLIEAHRVDVHARDADLAATLLELGSRSPFDVVIDPGVDGRVSADLEDVPLVDVLDRLVRAQGYRYELHGRLLHVRIGGSETRRYRVGRAQGADAVDFWSELQRALATLVGEAGAAGLVVSKPFGLVTLTASESVHREVAALLSEIEQSTGRSIEADGSAPWWSRPRPVRRLAASAGDATNEKKPAAELWREFELSVAEFQAGFDAHQRGELNDAIDAYRAALARDPEFVEAMVNLARVFADRFDLDGASRWIERAGAVRPDYYDVYNVMGLVAVRRGDVGRVIDALTHALELKSDDVNALSNLGAALILDGRFGEAARRLDEALRLDPTHLESTLNLALAHDRASRGGPAAVYYRRFLELSGGDDPVRSQVRERLDELGAVATPAVSAAAAAVQPPEIR